MTDLEIINLFFSKSPKGIEYYGETLHKGYNIYVPFSVG